ncbi:MAG: BREX-1 system adenine-specific DNA-methyltransferase PglX [Treponema sp.]|nr:BREX-1 system adenine-specific DNA-methyltransferase PglX [Treponema sp.]
MDKTVIRNFAIEARRSLIQMARDNAARVGITASVVGKPASAGSDFEIYRTPTGGETTLTGTALRRRKNLVRRIGEIGSGIMIHPRHRGRCIFRIVQCYFVSVN